MATTDEPYHFVYENHGNGVESYEFVPHDNYPGIDRERKLSALYEEILDKIPYNDDLEPGVFHDYPETTVEQFKAMLGKCGKKKTVDPRHFVVIGNYAFFKRYTTDSDAGIMYHYLNYHAPGYDAVHNKNMIEDLHKLLQEKSADQITEDEMLTIIGDGPKRKFIPQ